MFGDVALVQHLEADAGGESEVMRNHRVLPGDGVVTYLRVLVIVTLPHDPVIHRVIGQVQTQFLEKCHLRIVRRKEPGIEVGGGDINPVGLGGVNLFQGFPHVLHGIRVFQLFSQLDHPVFHCCKRGSRQGALGFIAFACHQHEKRYEQADKSFHTLQNFSHRKAPKTYPCKKRRNV